MTEKEKLNLIREDFFLNCLIALVSGWIMLILGIILRGFDNFTGIVTIFFVSLLFLMSWLTKRAEEKRLLDEEELGRAIDGMCLEIELERILRN